MTSARPTSPWVAVAGLAIVVVAFAVAVVVVVLVVPGRVTPERRETHVAVEAELPAERMDDAVCVWIAAALGPLSSTPVVSEATDRRCVVRSGTSDVEAVRDALRSVSLPESPMIARFEEPRRIDVVVSGATPIGASRWADELGRALESEMGIVAVHVAGVETVVEVRVAASALAATEHTIDDVARALEVSLFDPAARESPESFLRLPISPTLRVGDVATAELRERDRGPIARRGTSRVALVTILVMRNADADEVGAIIAGHLVPGPGLEAHVLDVERYLVRIDDPSQAAAIAARVPDLVVSADGAHLEVLAPHGVDLSALAAMPGVTLLGAEPACMWITGPDDDTRSLAEDALVRALEAAAIPSAPLYPEAAPTMRATLDELRAAELRVSASSLASAAAAVGPGHEISMIGRGPTVVLRYDGPLGDAPVSGRRGAAVRVADVARLEVGPPVRRMRRGGVRTTALLVARDDGLGEVIASVALPPGVVVELEGP